jgi:peptidoglycan/LPS O-acetylase OafA/YrhL
MFLTYIHNLRGVAILYIVAGHSISAFDWEGSPLLERLAKTLVGNGTVFFVFISGYLFQFLSKNYRPKAYLITKLKTVLLPYFLVSIPAILYFLCFKEHESVYEGFYENSYWFQVVYFYLTGIHLAPFWFIPMIALFYLISPVLIIFDRSAWAYTLLPFFILLSCIVSRGDVLQSFVHFFSVYVLGMLLSHYREPVNSAFINPIIMIALLAVYVFLLIMEIYFVEEGKGFHVNLLRKLVLCCVFIGLFVKFHLYSKVLSILADLSFGIFFVHSYLITALKMLQVALVGDYLEANLLNFILFISFILLLSVAVVASIKTVFPTKSRYLIGS